MKAQPGGSVISTLERLARRNKFPFADFQSGDNDAFRLLYDVLAPSLTIVVSRTVSCNDECDDIIQSAFSKLFDNRHKLKSANHINNWLFTVTRNLATDYLRRNVREQTAKDYLRHIPVTPEFKGIEWEKYLPEAITRLSPRRQKIVLLFYYEGKNSQEIARILGISAQTVRNSKIQAIKFLHKTLKNMRIDEEN